ncbi:MAG: choice-of-anchor J domain-containing protein, partial [Ferruginibacter sp.]
MKKTLLLLFIVMISTFSVNAQLTESFDATTFPPAGWTTVIVSVGDGSASGIPGDVWDRVTTSTENPSPTVNPHSGAGMARYDCYEFDPTSKADLITPVMDFTGGLKRVTFWMYRSATYSDQDSLTVYVNTAASGTGATFLGKIIRFGGSAPAVPAVGWYQYFYDIPASFNGASNYIIFRGTGEFGLSILIDDVVVANQPSCRPPSAITGSNYNYAAGTATFAWTAPVAPPVGYEWALNATGTAPATGTTVAGNTVSVTGITTGVTNYLFVRTNCGAGDFSAWDSLAFAALPCATIVAPVNGATNVPQSQVFSWNAVAGANGYSFYLGPSAGSEVNIGSLAGTSTPITNLTPVTTYSWYIVPRIGTAAAINSCTSNSFTTGAEGNTPANNTCAGAIAITSANIAANPVAGTTIGATLTLVANSCAGAVGSADDDVWFQFNTSSLAPTGTLTIAPAAPGGISDIVAQVYAAASCGSLGTAVTCADATDAANAEVIDLSTLSPNTHYYMRVYSFAGTAASRGAFTIVASAGNTLPVRLATFSARRSNGVNILNWSTQEELSTSRFIIERSNDARNFVSIGQVAATGNSNTIRNYTFTDIHPAKGNNYYRLRTVDKDNSSKLSVIRSIRNEGIADITLYPNPVKNQLSLSIDADKATDGHLS